MRFWSPFYLRLRLKARASRTKDPPGFRRSGPRSEVDLLAVGKAASLAKALQELNDREVLG